MDERIKRIVAAIIDFYIAVFISSAFILIITLGKMTLTPFSLTAYLTIFLLFMLFKDIVFKNTSIGKRIFKFIVVKTDGTDLRFSDVIKRNIPIVFLFPVEALMLVFNNRRIGDIWAKTTIVCNSGVTDRT